MEPGGHRGTYRARDERGPYLDPVHCRSRPGGKGACQWRRRRQRWACIRDPGSPAPTGPPVGPERDLGAKRHGFARGVQAGSRPRPGEPPGLGRGAVGRIATPTEPAGCAARARERQSPDGGFPPPGTAGSPNGAAEDAPPSNAPPRADPAIGVPERPGRSRNEWRKIRVERACRRVFHLPSGAPPVTFGKGRPCVVPTPVAEAETGKRERTRTDRGPSARTRLRADQPIEAETVPWDFCREFWAMQA